jgi:hypothetical protein
MASLSLLTTYPQMMIPVSVKLDDDNFLTWKMQATGTIRAFKLQKFVDYTSNAFYKSWDEVKKVDFF